MFNLDNKKYKIDKRNLIKCILIFILFYFIDYIELIPIKIFDITSFNGPVAVILNTFKSIVLTLILFLIYRKELIIEWDKFRNNAMDNLDIGVKYWFIGLIGMVVSNLIINFVFNGGSANNEQIVQEFISYLPWLMLINAGMIAPFNEEIVFRKAFIDAFKNKWLFVILSAVVFGSMHVVGNVEVWTDILFIIPYGFLGGAFALAYYETKTVFTSYFLHMFHNTILIIVSLISLGIVLI